jgi:LDH2 family malate/lactate/ureidoglycolate dehydrogenase
MTEDEMSIRYVAPDVALAHTTELIVANGVPERDAAIVAGCLVRADLRGVDTHGLALLAEYLHRLRLGLINGTPELVPKESGLAARHLDGQDGFGFVVATRAMDEAMRLALTTGVAAVSVHRSTHYGMAANYVLQASEAGMIGIAFTNASRAMPPHGSREPILGTSPLAFGIPVRSGPPIVLDMSPSVAARGKIRQALRRGQQIPLGYAIDADGEPTTDPAKALEGLLLPVGGPKGSGLALMMDILGGVISGSAFGGQVGNRHRDFDRPQDVGHLLIAMRPDLFIPLDEYHERLELLVERIHSSAPAAGFDEVVLPGELEHREELRRRCTGLPLSGREIRALSDEAGRAGIAPLALSDVPLHLSPPTRTPSPNE